MATLNGTGHSVITENKRWDDFASLKQYHKQHHTKQKDCSMSQLLTTSYAVADGSDFTIVPAAPAAADVVYVSTLNDDGTQAAKDVYISYQTTTGLIKSTVNHILPTTANTDTEITLGHTDVYDTCASVAGDVITMTAMAATANQYDGWYTVGISGNGNQVGVANLIISHTVHASTPAFTLTDTPNGDTATDLISFQEYPCNDFYRVREMWCEVECLDDKTIRLGDIDSTNIYAGIGEGQRYMVSPNFFTQPAATCDSYLGRVKAFCNVDSTVTEVQGAQIKVFYTPKEQYTTGGAVRTEIEIPCYGAMDWQPCVLLEPATDVYIQVKQTEGAKIDEIFLEVSYLEVYK